MSNKWPYGQSAYNMRVKANGFWRDEKTVRILECFLERIITEGEATKILRAAPGDVSYYANKLSIEGLLIKNR